MLKKALIIFFILSVFGSTVVCNLGGGGNSEAALKASIPTNDTAATGEAGQVIEEKSEVTDPTPTSPPAAPSPAAAAGPLTAAEALEQAGAAARAWQSDATLNSLSTSLLGPLDVEGKSTGWAIAYWSPSAKAMLSLTFINGTLNTPPAVPLPSDPGKIPAQDSVILDMKKIYETAAAAGGQKYIDQDHYVMAGLTPYPLDNSIPTWYINYHAKDNTVSFTVIIDARSGEVMQSINTAEGG